MHRTDTVVIGGGQAGLAMSRCLTEQGRDHVVLERGRTGERWRSARWDSLHLLTPNWMTRLPGWRYEGPEPESFMSRDDFVGFLEGYAGSFSAPVQQETSVESVEADGSGYVVRTDQGSWRADNVVIATGDCQDPRIPPAAARLDHRIHQVSTTTYRSPASLPDGGVLVVGASASGVQLADELRAAGREVTLAVGTHSRMPRSYRGMDIMWWLDRTGAFDRMVDQVPDLDAARREPSSQLVGRPTDHPGAGDLDLRVLTARGVRLTGRFTGAGGVRVSFADDLGATTGAADIRLTKLLERLDGHADRTGLAGELLAAHRPGPVPTAGAPTSLDLRTAGISTILWATGYRRSYPWLKVPVLDPSGEVRHDRGVTPSPGLYVLGLRFQHRRSSHFIDGVGHDARHLADHIARASGARTLTV
jgi:putative flavoprotein involved in K+ transport